MVKELRNSNGLVARFTDYGARWVSMWVPAGDGSFEDVVLGFDTLSGYQKAGEQYHGAIVGRVCGRISNARFTLDGKEYRLASNDAYGAPVRNHLHGGLTAFHNRIWQVKSESAGSVTFSLFSPDGEEGYPGNLAVDVTYTLTEGNVLRMECRATPDKATPVNITNHAFFNLQSGAGRKNISSQRLTVYSSGIIECDENLVPTGAIIPAGSTSVDLTEGFSVAYALRHDTEHLVPAALLEDPASGRRLLVSTNQPSLQVYNAYLMDGKDIGKGHYPYYAGAGIALEPQGYPDAPNRPEFPSIITEARRTYYNKTEYFFSVLPHL